MRQLLLFLEVSCQAVPTRIATFLYSLRLDVLILYIQFSTILSLPTLYLCLFIYMIFQQDSQNLRKQSDQIRSVAQSCPTLCDPMNRSMPGLPVHHQLPEFTQTHVHRVSDAIQPSHPLSSPSPPARNPSQHQSLFQ